MSPIKYLLSIIFAAIYACFGYLLEKENVLHLSLLFGTSFLLYFFFIITTKDREETNKILWLSMFFRLIFIASIPCLSEDYFRFIWDGKLFINGFNPYLFIPADIQLTEIANNSELTSVLFNGLNKPDYYSFYPPINELFFALGAFFSKFGLLPAIIGLRIPLLIAEFFTLKYGIKLLDALNLPQHHILIYALNPLVILEISGNLNFIGIALLFILLGIYWLKQNNWAISAFWWAISISLHPIGLLFIPVFLKKMELVKSFLFYSLLAIVLGVTFLPFLNESLITNLLFNVKHYFQDPKFNTIFYSFLKWVSIKTLDHNALKNVGYTLLIVPFLISLGIYFYKTNTWKDVLRKMLFVNGVFLLLVTNIPPWSIIPLLLWSVFIKNYRFALFWSVILAVSYPLYFNDNYANNELLFGIKYGLIIIGFISELILNKKLSN